MVAAVAHHLIRRGVQHLTREQYVAKLQHTANLYQDGENSIPPEEFMPILVTILAIAFGLWSINYTIGNVVASLCAIESPSGIPIFAPHEHTQATGEEKTSLLSEDQKEPEVIELDLVANTKPITSSIRASLAAIHRAGGFTARWRGLGLASLYHILHAFTSNVIAVFLGFGVVGQSLAYILVSLILVRLHLAWTHKMIAMPSQKSWYSRLPSRRECRVLLLPTFVHAIAQQMSFLLPLAIAYQFNLVGTHVEHLQHTASRAMSRGDCTTTAIIAGKVGVVVLTYVLHSLYMLLPASVALTRIEAALLGPEEATVVPFDRAAIVGELELDARGSPSALFRQAWKSFDSSSRSRLIKMYAKMGLAQFAFVVFGMHIVMLQLWLVGEDRVSDLIKSAHAQIKLASMDEPVVPPS